MLELPQDHQRRRSYTPAYPPALAAEVAVAAGVAGGDDGSDAHENRTSVYCRAADEPAGLFQNEADVDDAANDGKEENAVTDTTAMGEGTATSDAEGDIDLVGPIGGNEHLQSRLQELADASGQPVHVSFLLSLRNSPTSKKLTDANTAPRRNLDPHPSGR